MTGDSPQALLAEAVRRDEAGKPREAVDFYRRAIALAPANAEAWHRLAGVLLRLADLEQARACARQAVALEPAAPLPLNTLGTIDKARGDLASAEASFRRAIELAPDLFVAHNNLGTTLAAAGRIDEATAALERAVAIDPERAQAWSNLGNLYKEQGRVGAALDAYDRALALDPLLRVAFSNRLAALKVSSAHGDDDALEEALEFARRFEVRERARREPLSHSPDPDRQLAIGYLSPDCHAAVAAFIEPVLAAHDPREFRVVCYYDRPPRFADPALASRVAVRVTAGRSDDEVHALILGDRIDVLVDIAGHTGHNRLPVVARRAAPVQIEWLDYLGTTGLESVDYRITDRVADPEGVSDRLHSERLLRMPDTQWCWSPDPQAPAVAALPALARGHPTFGSFNHATKLTDAALELWAALLARLPTARLRVVGVAPGEAQRRVVERLGAAAREGRVECRPRVGAESYRALFAEVDVALDPFPFSGATTTLDALWQGVPVLTCPQARTASRSSASLLAALGLHDWVAAGSEDFLARAERLVADVDALAALRSDLRGRLAASPLTDAGRFTRALERHYRDAWRRWCATREPTGVPASDREADLRLGAAESFATAGRLDDAIAAAGDVLRYQPGWQRAQRVYVACAAAWARGRAAESLAAPAPPLPADPPRVSVVICSIDPAKLAAAMATYSTALAGVPHEFVAIRDARSLAEGYNRGATRASGELLVFSHDDVTVVPEQFGARLLDHLAEVDVLGVAGTDRLIDGAWPSSGPPHIHGNIVHAPPGGRGLLYFACGLRARRIEGIQGLDGVFIAARRAAWERIGFDETTFDGFHLYDSDFAFRAHLAGLRVGVACDLLLVHASLGRYDRGWRRYNERFRAKFAGRLASPDRRSAGASAAIHCRVDSIDQAKLLRAAFLHFGYGR